MAATPYFVISPNTLLSIIGLLRGPDRTVPTPPEDWRKAKIDVVIPTLNEEVNIIFCLHGLCNQTVRPRQVILVDDGSKDHTVEYAKDFCAANGLPLVVIQRKAPIGKTPTIKRQAREFDSDVEFILDGDTVLTSPEYIARTVEELYKGVGIASACGNVFSFRQRDRRQYLTEPPLNAFMQRHPDAPTHPKKNIWQRLQMAITSTYRDCLYIFLQKFVYKGQMVFYGSITHPVGCAVAYRRKYIEDLFAKYEPVMGDDLTNSEDIFIGFALLDEGYRNIQVPDVFCRSQEPEARRLPRQFYMWSSAFLQSCYYFNSLMMSPFKSLKRWRHEREFRHSRAGKEALEKRVIKEQYRQAFGSEYTRKYGRPAGWGILLSAVEKVAFPCILLWMVAMRMWEPLLMTVLAETLLALSIMAIVAPKRHRLEYVGKGILITPIRYSALLFDLSTMLRFAADLWIYRDKKWRK
jgi:glycosyltransferase involved in cell wall biosynthesis